MTNVSCFFDEFLGTAVLLICVCAVTDRNNGPPPAGLVPLCLFFTIFAIGAGIGLETGQHLCNMHASHLLLLRKRLLYRLGYQPRS